jgi:hypothetical protein
MDQAWSASSASSSELAGELEHGLVVGLPPQVEEPDRQGVAAVAHRPGVVEDGVHDEGGRIGRRRHHRVGRLASHLRGHLRHRPVAVEPGRGQLARAHLEHVGVDRAGHDLDHPDPRRSQFDPERVVDGRDRRLGSAVGGVERHRGEDG